MGCKDKTSSCLKKSQNAPRPSEHPPVRGEKMSQRLGGIKGCKYNTSSWHLNGVPYGSNLGSTVCYLNGFPKGGNLGSTV